MSDEVQARFAAVAANYARSSFHASPARLQEVVALSRPEPDDVALDVATGTGNTALALAPHLRVVIGVDLTRQMLAEAQRRASERGIDNARWVRGDASRLPFRDGVFHLYTARAAPHHFPDLAEAVAEAVRVLRRGGRACFVDCSPPPAARDYLQAVEVGRDPTHVRSWTLQEWIDLLQDAGFEVQEARRRELDWDFEGWMANQAVDAERAVELAALVEAAEGEARRELRPERRKGRLFHAYWHALIRAVKR